MVFFLKYYKMDEIVSLEQAKLLKDLGFDWNCTYLFSKMDFEKEYKLYPSVFPENHNAAKFNNIDIISAPSIMMALKWLREIKNFHLYTNLSVESSEYESIYEVHIQQIDNGVDIWMHDNDYHSKKYKTYEEAMDDILTIALEYLKNS